MNYQTLANEIALPTYAGMSDAEIMDALNTPGASTRRAVPLAALLATAALNGSYAAVKATEANDNAPAAVRGVCASVLVLLSGVFQEINLDDPRVQASLGALAQAGVLSAAQMAEIDALAVVPGRSRAQELGLGDVVEADIQAARDWLAIQALRQRLVNGYNAALVMLAQTEDMPGWDAVVAVVEASQ